MRKQIKTYNQLNKLFAEAKKHKRFDFLEKMASYAFKVGEERNKKKEDWRNKGPVVKSKEQINIIKQFLKR